MSPILYALATALFQILAPVGVGTNLALYQVFFALLSGRFLSSRGALVPALAATGLSDDAVRRSVAALAYGKWNLADLVSAWQQSVRQQGRLSSASPGRLSSGCRRSGRLLPTAPAGASGQALYPSG